MSTAVQFTLYCFKSEEIFTGQVEVALYIENDTWQNALSSDSVVSVDFPQGNIKTKSDAQNTYFNNYVLMM